jgi:hypothetical protein
MPIDRCFVQSNAEANFLQGHLAVLLGLLCLDSQPKHVDSILRLLPGSSRSGKLKLWIDTIRDFVALYATLAIRFAQALHTSRRDHTDEDADVGDGVEIDGLSTDDGDASVGDGSSGPTNSSAVPALFADDAQRSRERGVELAERVIRVLSDLL